MSTTSPSSPPRRRKKHNKSERSTPATSDDDAMSRHNLRGTSTSLESIAIQPRTPKTPHSSHRVNGWTPSDGEPIDEMEMSLLGEEERRQAVDGLSVEEEQEYLSQGEKKPMSAKDKRAIGLLIILCMSLIISCRQSC